MQNTPNMPDASTDPEAMDLAAVEAELRGYDPPSAAALERGAEHLARRALLWVRLDALLEVRKPAIATPAQRGAQQA
jgi:hypothetical protein